MTSTVPFSPVLAPAGVAPERAEALVADALLSMEDGELFAEDVRSEQLTYDDGRLKGATRHRSRGFGLRAVCGEVAGLATGSVLTEDAIARAAQSIEPVARGYQSKANLPLEAPNVALYPSDDPLAAGGTANRAALLGEIDAWLRARDPRVVQVSVTLAQSMQAVEIVRTNGERRGDLRPLVRLNVSVTVEQHGRRESAGEGCGGRRDVEEIVAEDNWRRVASAALDRALVMLDADPAPAGEMTVVLGPGWPGVLLHEAVGHGLEGDFNRKGTSAFSGLMGQRVAAPGVTIVDDGAIAQRRGSLTVDDEGVPTRRNVLIEDGILVGFMQDRQNARLMGTSPTGNGRRQSHAHIPMPRMTNTFMLAGDREPAEIIEGVEHGLYAVNFGGGQVDITSGRFVFEASQAFMIERGKVTRPVKGAMLVGNGPQALLRVSAVGNDLELDAGIGTCGKEGQGVPVGVGQPTLRIDAMTVGGTAR